MTSLQSFAPKPEMVLPMPEVSVNSSIDQDSSSTVEDLHELDLPQIIASHDEWLRSEGVTGRRAVLAGYDLSGRDLHGVNLSRADLRCINLTGSALEEADLSGAKIFEADLSNAILYATKFTGADLRGSKLTNARLVNATFADADLRDSDLSGVIGMSPASLRGADLTGAHLPDHIAKFESLGQAGETARSARKTLLILFLSCIYTWLTIATTTDARLLANNATSPLPIIQTPITIADFYLVVPLKLTSLFVYLHLYLQRLWEELADLPSILPDGIPVHRKVYPWLIVGFIRSHIAVLRSRRTFLSRLEASLATVLAWWITPMAVASLWFRYLSRHDWYGTAVHIVLVSTAVGIALLFHGYARRSLRGHTATLRPRRSPRSPHLHAALGAIATGALLILLSGSAIEGEPRRSPHDFAGPEESFTLAEITTHLNLAQWEEPASTELSTWTRNVLTGIGVHRSANLREAEISTKPDNWWLARSEDELRLVRGANLVGRDLRYADAERAYLVRADLRLANLEQANFAYADFTKARLEQARLVHTNLFSANLREADLRYSIVRRGNLGFADLSGANLVSANFQGAFLASAKLDEAILTGAIFEKANLTKASLARVRSARKGDTRVLNLRGALLLLSDLQDADLNGADLRECYFAGADLRRANLRGANLQRANFSLMFRRPGETAEFVVLQVSTRMEDANLSFADLSGANLKGVMGLTQNQLDRACGDSSTALPDGFSVKPCEK